MNAPFKHEATTADVGRADLLADLQAARQSLALECASIMAIERGLEAGRLDMETALALVADTWPEHDAGTGYSFGAHVARDASAEAFARRGGRCHA